jgi:hypothetical protein
MSAAPFDPEQHPILKPGERIPLVQGAHGMTTHSFDSDAFTDRPIRFVTSANGDVQFEVRGQPSRSEFDPDAVGRAYGEDPPPYVGPPKYGPPPPRPNGYGRASSPAPLIELRGDVLAAATPDRAELEFLPLLGRNGYIVRGFSHLFSGAPRVGKTELSCSFLADCVNRGMRVLLITEEAQPIWEYRLSRRPAAWENLKVIFGLGIDPSRLLERACSGPEVLVDVDAIRNVLQPEDENDNSEIARVVNPWITGARAAAKTLVMQHHQRKGGGEHGEGIAGGHALLGAFDVALEVLRDRSQHPRRRIIRAYARLISPGDLMYEMDEATGDFRALGQPGAVALADVEDRCLALLTAEWQTTKEVHDGLGEPRPSLEQVRVALLGLGRSGVIDRDPPVAAGEARGRSHRWRLLGSSS